MPTPRSLSLLAVLAVALFAGCGEDASTSALGDWTRTRGPSLTEDFRRGGTAAYYFGSIADVAVRGDGAIAVADGEAHHVKVLGPDGSLRHTLGQEGAGPGEFQRLATVQWARGDSLYAYDPAASRLTVFAPEPPHSLVRTVPVSREDGVPVRVHVLETAMVAEISRQVPPSDGSPRYRRARTLDATGAPADTLFATRRQGSVVIADDGTFMFWPVPLGYASVITRGPNGRLYHGRQDSLRIVAHRLDGTAEVVADVPTPAEPIPDGLRDSVLAQINNTQMRQAAAKAMPKHRPAWTDLVVAEDGRLWVERPSNPSSPTKTTWWILDPDAKTIEEVKTAGDVRLESVQDDSAYGTTTTSAGAPVLVRLTVPPES